MKKKLIIIGLLLSAIALVLFLFISSTKKPQDEEVTIELPPPVIDNMVEEKLDAYEDFDRNNSRRSYADYYNNLPSLTTETETATEENTANSSVLPHKDTQKQTQRPSVVVTTTQKKDIVESVDVQVKSEEQSRQVHTGFITAVSNKKSSRESSSSERNEGFEVRISTVADTKIISSGQLLTMRIHKGIRINGYDIPQNTHIFATTQISGDRIQLQLSSIRWRDKIIPISAKIYDMDGMEGINIPNQKKSIVEDVGKDITSSIMSTVTARVSSIAGAALQSLGSSSPSMEYIVPAGYELILKTSEQ